MRVSPDLRMAVVGAPAYLAHHPRPATPQDLTEHRCINLRMPSSQALYARELERDERELRIRVDGQLAFNSASMIVRAAEDGLGLRYVMEDQVGEQLRSGRLVRVVEE